MTPHSDSQSLLEDVIGRFEQAWRSGEQSDLDQFLGRLEGEPPQDVLVELVHANLEVRLKSGEATRVEERRPRAEVGPAATCRPAWGKREQIPDQDSAVTAAGRHALAVRREDDTLHASFVALQFGDLVLAADVGDEEIVFASSLQQSLVQTMNWPSGENARNSQPLGMANE